MSTLYAFSNPTTAGSSIGMPVTPAIVQVELETQKSHKWTFLLANTIQFNKKGGYAIRLPKPDNATLCVWLERIISGGQCASLFVEQMGLDEVNFARIKQMATEHNVTLVNLLHQDDLQTNVIQGPW